MKRRTGAAVFCILLCLSLCACGGGTESAGPPEPDGNETLLTVDGVDIPAWKVRYWMALGCDRTASEYGAVGQTPDWSARVDGGTLADFVKARALSDTVLYAVVDATAERYGCTLTEEDEAAVLSRWEERCAAHGGEEPYLAVIARYGLDRARAMDLFRTGQRYGKLWEQCRTGGAFSPDAAALAAMEQERGRVRFDRILIHSGDRNFARGRAEHLFSMLNAAADQAGLFSELAASSDDPKGPRILGDGSIDDGLAEIVRNLAEGQLSGIVESGDGFSILRRLPADREGLLSDWMDRTLETAAEQADVRTTAQYARLSAAELAESMENP